MTTTNPAPRRDGTAITRSRRGSAALTGIWAILPDRLAAMAAALDEYDDLAQLEADFAAIDEGDTQAALFGPKSTRAGAVAVLPLAGLISQKPSWMSLFFGGTSTEAFLAEFRTLLADETVKAIVFDVDSPGGSVAGVPELADAIYAARGSKPIIAVANTLMASAAYHIASQADEVVVTPSGMAGSIGVYAMHVDQSRALDMIGIDVTLVSAGKYKVEGNPFEPLGDEARAAIQHDVDVYYDLFTKAVARGLGVSAAEVRSGYGEGRVLTARDAVRVGLAKRVETLEAVIGRASWRPRNGQRAGATVLGSGESVTITDTTTLVNQSTMTVTLAADALSPEGGPYQRAAGPAETPADSEDRERRRRRARRWQVARRGSGAARNGDGPSSGH